MTSTLLAPTTVPTHRRAERLLIPPAGAAGAVRAGRVATVTDHTDARYGFAAPAVLSALAGLTAALLLRRTRP